MLMDGDEGVPRNSAVGIQWMERSALGGFVPAQTRLAIAYEKGEGTAPDASRARLWYTEAGLAGDTYSQYQLSRYYYRGLGDLSPDKVATFGWLELALLEGYTPAQDTMRHCWTSSTMTPRPVIPELILSLARHSNSESPASSRRTFAAPCTNIEPPRTAAGSARALR